MYFYGEEPAGGWGWTRGGYELVREIARKYTAGEYPSAVVRFDPSAFKNINFLCGHTPDELARVPAVMLQPSPGQPIPPLADEDYDWSGEGF